MLNEQMVIEMLLKHEQDIQEIKETMATKDDIRQIMGVLDEILKIVRKNEQELLFVNQRFKKLETHCCYIA